MPGEVVEAGHDIDAAHRFHDTRGQAAGPGIAVLGLDRDAERLDERRSTRAIGGQDNALTVSWVLVSMVSAFTPTDDSALLESASNVRHFSEQSSRPTYLTRTPLTSRATALVTLKCVQIAGGAFGLDSKQVHLALALGAGQQRFNNTRFGRLSH